MMEKTINHDTALRPVDLKAAWIQRHKQWAKDHKAPKQRVQSSAFMVKIPCARYLFGKPMDCSRSGTPKQHPWHIGKCRSAPEILVKLVESNCAFFWQALNLICDYVGDFQLANTSQNLGMLPICRGKDTPLPCLTLLVPTV